MKKVFFFVGIAAVAFGQDDRKLFDIVDSKSVMSQGTHQKMTNGSVASAIQGNILVGDAQYDGVFVLSIYNKQTNSLQRIFFSDGTGKFTAYSPAGGYELQAILEDGTVTSVTSLTTQTGTNSTVNLLASPKNVDATASASQSSGSGSHGGGAMGCFVSAPSGGGSMGMKMALVILSFAIALSKHARKIIAFTSGYCNQD